MAESSSSGISIGFSGLLTIIFIVLKLTGHIDWHWFWVVSPSLIPVIAISSFFLVVGLFFLFVGISAGFIVLVRHLYDYIS